MSFVCVCCKRECETRTSPEDLCHPCQLECGVDYCEGRPGHDIEAKRKHMRTVWSERLKHAWGSTVR